MGNRTRERIALLIVLCMLAIGIIMPAEVTSSDLACYLASQGDSAGASGTAIISAGMIRVTPEIAVALIDAGLISCSTGVGIIAGGILGGVGLAL